MVLAYGALRSGDRDGPAADAAAVVEAVHADGGLAKVIVESAKLSDDELREACRIVAASGAEFGKTSTGFAGGATVAAVEAMRADLPDHVAIKASAGIRTADAAEAMLAAGASRIGTSSALAILAELRARVVA
jgi:deoxyribose-phosphate aldolase